MFQLSLSVTTGNLDAAKLALTKALPEVKSSHRCEAMARGFGYRTYAAFLAAARTGEAPVARIDGAVFRDYLAQHDFHVAPSALYHAGAKAALADVAAGYPTLAARGFGAGHWKPHQSPSERRRELADSRAELVSDYAVEPFLASLAFVARIERTKTIRPATNSYWLKHVAEKFAGAFPEGETLGPVYVPNGVFIAAAIQAGFKVKPHTDEYGRETLNAGFNMGKRSLYDLDAEIRPNGPRAQARRAGERQRVSSPTNAAVF